MTRFSTKNLDTFEINEVTVEPLILPIVNILNSVDGVYTAASCQGHFLDGHISEPYVAYYSSMDVAKSIEMFIRTEELALPWYQLIVFDKQYDPFFSIRVNEKALSSKYISPMGNLLPSLAKRFIEKKIWESLTEDAMCFQKLPNIIESHLR